MHITLNWLAAKGFLDAGCFIMNKHLKCPPPLPPPMCIVLLCTANDAGVKRYRLTSCNHRKSSVMPANRKKSCYLFILFSWLWICGKHMLKTMN